MLPSRYRAFERTLAPPYDALYRLASAYIPVDRLITDPLDKLAAIAGRCSRDVLQVDDVLCGGFAGDKGFNRPELNEHAPRHLKPALPARCSQGYSSSRTCEIGLSEYSGFPYRSTIRLVDSCARAAKP